MATCIGATCDKLLAVSPSSSSCEDLEAIGCDCSGCACGSRRRLAEEPATPHDTDQGPRGLREGGVMRRALDDVLDLAFGEFELHRVQAAIMPHNERSRTLIKRLGFREIGLAERHLLLDGEWKDHILYEKIAR